VTHPCSIVYKESHHFKRSTSIAQAYYIFRFFFIFSANGLSTSSAIEPLDSGCYFASQGFLFFGRLFLYPSVSSGVSDVLSGSSIPSFYMKWLAGSGKGRDRDKESGFGQAQTG